VLALSTIITSPPPPSIAHSHARSYLLLRHSPSNARAIATNSDAAASLPSALTPNGNSNLTTTLTYSALFSPTSVTGANGATQSEAYDGYNRPAYTTSVDGAITNYSHSFGPNTQTASISTTVNNNNTTTTHWRKTIFDGFGRTISVQTGHDSTTVNTVDTVYGACGCSPLGKAIKVSMPYGPGETEVWTTYIYDASGRQLTSTAPDGSVTTTSYSGNSVTTTDPAGAWKTNVMDAFGNIVAVYEPDPTTGTTTSNSPVTNYTYNGANQLTNVSMIRGGITQTRTFTYSGSDLTSETTPDGTVTYTTTTITSPPAPTPRAGRRNTATTATSASPRSATTS
jgi:YD repeat-containing protein